MLPVPGQLKAAPAAAVGSGKKRRARQGEQKCDVWVEAEAARAMDGGGVGDSGSQGQKNGDTHNGAGRKGKKRRCVATDEPHKQRKQQ